MPAKVIDMPKLEIKPHPNGGHQILVDGKDLGEHCTRAILTITPEHTILVMHNVVVDEVQTAEMNCDRCVMYRVCADCGRQLSDDPTPEAD